MSTETNGGKEPHVQLSRAGALGPEWTPPVPRYRLTLTITGNTLDEIERELVVQTRGGFLLDSVPKYDAELAAWYVAAWYDAELAAWWAGRKAERKGAPDADE